MEKKRLKISFSHPNTLNVMVLHAPADRITSTLNMGDLGSDIRVHETSNHDLLELIRASQAELAARGFVEADATRLDAINEANAASGLPPVSMS